MTIKAGKLLSNINSPEDLRQLREDELTLLSEELRQFIIDSVAKNPSHFGSSLGVVELTIALHYVFNTPYDKLIWDVGHQAYGHKIITGRRDVFHTNRRFNGISGFPNMKESEYDSFGVGHSSTSISAALGMAIASKQKGELDRQHIAVIGDAAITGGMAFEALNHAGSKNPNLLIILNDNNIAIDPSVGAIKEYLTDITTSQTYNKFKDDVWHLLGKVSKYGPNAQLAVQKIENAIKAMLMKQSNLFEALNFRYFGPIDGNDVIRLVRILNDLKKIPGPKVLHIVTVKGKGFKSAEENQTKWHHSPGVFNSKSGELINNVTNDVQPPLYQEVFGKTLLELAENNEKIYGITPAMLSGSSLNIMQSKFPKRTIDVGIAEQHAVTFSAGLASQGLIPYCNIYSSFLQRAYDQIIHDVALQKLNVVLCIDRAGLVGADGATHHGAFDLAFLNPIPNLIISAPMDEIELRNLLFTAQLKNHGPFAIRYPRGRGVNISWEKPFEEIVIGKGRIISEGEKIAVLSLGNVGNYAKDAIKNIFQTKNISIAHYDMRFLKPLDETLLHDIFSKFKYIITVEDGVIIGGFGSTILQFMNDNNYNAKVKRLGIPDKFIEHGKQEELHEECGYDTNAIIEAINQLLTEI